MEGGWWVCRKPWLEEGCFPGRSPSRARLEPDHRPPGADGIGERVRSPRPRHGPRHQTRCSRDHPRCHSVGPCFGLSPFSLAHGWSIDALTALRWEFFGARRDPASTPVAVIPIDEETYETPPFKGSPTLTWTTEIGRVLNAVIDGGAKVVGFDIVFPTSIEQSEIPFGDDLLGARMRGFDRAFLRSLATGSSAGKVVLGETLRGDRPSPGQRIAVGQQKNIRALNIYSDPDEVMRRIPLTFPA